MTTVGFISPPDWSDPSPAEFAELAGVHTLAVELRTEGFSWSLEEIAAFEPQLAAAAIDLVRRGARVVGITGTPFGWAGIADGDRPHVRNDRIAAACGAPVVSAVSGVVDWLEDLGARRLGLAATYYEEAWLGPWSGLLEGLGFEVAIAASLVGAGVVEGPLSADDTTHWAPTPDMITANVEFVAAADPGGVDAVVVSGAGARTLAVTDRLESVARVPVVASDTALYRAVQRTLAS